MKISTKFLLILLEMALLPTLLLTFIIYSNSRSAITSTQINHLESIADIQKQHAEEVIRKNEEKIALLNSKLALRTILDSYNKKPNQILRDELVHNIDETKSSVTSINNISLYGVNGSLVVSTDPTNAQKSLDITQQNLKEFVINDLRKDDNGKPYFRLFGQLYLNERLIGYSIVNVNADDLVTAFKNHEELGKTGDAFLVKKVSKNKIVNLTDIRDNPNSSFKNTYNTAGTPIFRAAHGEESTFNDILSDNGRPAIAVTRYLNETDWGLVVIIDRAEALQSISDLNNLLIFLLGASVLVLVFIAGGVTSSISTPIIRLKEKANLMAGGDLDQHFYGSSGDEIGELGIAFNTMAIKLKNYYADLEKKVDEQTQEMKHVLENSESKNLQLEDTKKAILNILEDLEDEKNKLSEISQKDEAVLSSIGDCIIVTDEYGRITRVNPETERVLGYNESDLLGKGIVSALPTKTVDGKTVPPEERAVFEALSTGKTVHAHYQLIKKDKSTIIADFTATPYVINGKPAGVIDVFRDISEQAAIDKSKTEFVSLASHQLRTPLSTINWYLEMVLGGDAGKITPEQSKYLTEVHAANQRMVTLVNSLLNVSRIDLGTFSIEPQPIDLEQVVNNVISELQGPIHNKKHKINLNIQSKLEPYNADPKLTHIIFQNLISNAVKYTQNKGTIGVNIEVNKENLLIEVSDNGYGIPKKQQSKIFSKLFRADNVLTKDTDGTGLGLYMLKAIVEEAGGSVSFVSAENKGTTFTIKLPAVGMKVREGTKGLTNVTV